jgi:tetratricopeptide (TPR) repeat protein
MGGGEVTGTIVPAAERALLTSLMAQVVDAGGDVVGAAFAVAPDLLVTAAHVLDEGAVALVPLGSSATGFSLVDRFGEVEAMPSLAPWPDLAVLRIEGHRFSQWAAMGVRLPSVPFAARMVGFPLAGGAAGLSILTTTIDSEEGHAAPVLRLVAAQVEGGASGGPLVHPASRSVVGVVLATKDPDQVGGGFAVGLAALRDRWPVGAGPWPAPPPPEPWAAAYREGDGTSSPTLIVSRLRPNDPNLVVRVALVEQLERTGDETTVIRALGGSGGVGKSELALWWAHRCAADGDHAVVWWVDATSEATTHAGLADLAAQLRVEPGEDLAATAAAVDAALERLTRRWLVVFDNADTLDHLPGNLPTAGGGMALVTTRSTTAGAAIDAAELDIDVFSTDEAVTFLLKAVRPPLHGATPEVTAAAIADRVGRLPLALAQAAAFMNQESTSLAGYEALIAADLPTGIGVSAARHQRTVATLWVHIWPLLSEECLAVLARASLLAPRAIPVEALETETMAADAVLAALREAARYRVVTINPDAATVDMHQLTQLVASPSGGALPTTRAEVIARLRQLAASVDPTHPDSWPTWERLDPHVTHLYAPGEPPDLGLLGVVSRLATYRQHRGLNRDALPLFERAHADYEAALGADHLDTLATRSNLALSYADAGRAAETTAIQEAVLDDLRRLLDDDHPDTITARANLAVSYRHAGRTAEAITLEEAVLADRRRLLDDDHPDTITARANLAFSYWQAGRTAEAITLEEAVLADRRRLFGDGHPRTLTARGNLAVSYRHAGRSTEAITLQEEVLTTREHLLGDDHPDTITARANLAASYQEAGRTAEATTLKERVLVEQRQVLGDDHPETVRARANLAVSYWWADRITEAIALEEGVLADRRRLLGEDHPDTTAARDNLAVSYHDVGRQPEALDLLVRAVADSRRVLGDGHPDTVTRAERLERWRGEG